MNLTRPQRKIIRLQEYDYSDDGVYFVTICINSRLCLLGHIDDNQMILNNAGKMVDFWYHEMMNKFTMVHCLDYVIMPNHIHFILHIENDENTPRKSLSDIIQWFKIMTTNEYMRNVKEQGWQRFDKKLWQRSYYEHIIRNEKSYNEIVEYIENNPFTWIDDILYMN
ncbi:transposase [Lonepinella sp. BR2474]|uniref:transposase n=1 Tax=Lonepinella sp. BR2474 TaxID=3434548 RepID=UPI003F6E1500